MRYFVQFKDAGDISATVASAHAPEYKNQIEYEATINPPLYKVDPEKQTLEQKSAEEIQAEKEQAELAAAEEASEEPKEE